LVIIFWMLSIIFGWLKLYHEKNNLFYFIAWVVVMSTTAYMIFKEFHQSKTANKVNKSDGC